MIVLGLLSVIMISAVAFSISMQIERKGAANYRHATFARHALRGVLAKVMQKVDDDLGDDPADWDDNILASTNISATLDTTYAQVLTYEAIKNLPGAIQRAIRERYQWEQMGGKYVTPNAPQWIPLLLQRSDVDIRGRFAYAIIDSHIRSENCNFSNCIFLILF